MNYLVTGGCGFIGSHLTRKLSEQGNTVIVFDDFSTGKREKISDLNCLIRDVDISDKRALEIAGIELADSKIDVIFHLAALPRVQFVENNPRRTFEVNIIGIFNMLELACRLKVKRFIYAASSSAYGEQDSLPLKESMKPNPMNLYGAQKLAGEYLCRAYALSERVKTVCLRLFNVYGYGMTKDSPYSAVIAKFQAQRDRSEALTVFGDGNQSRDFTHVDDVCKAFLVAAENSKVGNGEVINIGSGESHSVNEIAKLIGGKIQYVPNSRREAQATRADISLAKKLIDWEPKKKLSLKTILECV